MKFKVFTLGLFLTNCLAELPDLFCYSCFYYEGHPESVSNCLNNTKYLRAKLCVPGEKPGFIEKFHYADTNISSVQSNAVKTCSVYSGLLDGKPIVHRSCDYEGLHDTCINTAELKFLGRPATNVTACFCDTGANCNGYKPTPTPPKTTTIPHTTKHPNNGASGSNITFNLLFTVAIYSMCLY